MGRAGVTKESLPLEYDSSKVLLLWKFGNSQKAFPATQLLVPALPDPLHIVNSDPLPGWLSKSRVPVSRPHAHWLSCIAVWAV